VAWSEGRRPLGAVLHTSHEPRELLQWPYGHDDSTRQFLQPSMTQTEAVDVVQNSPLKILLAASCIVQSLVIIRNDDDDDNWWWSSG